ncbi:MAG: GNAT family N-acetyltransferase [Verrucomicrobiales bacterium]|nr:GNAT family N-acetyltransferase [Verrucomicrobiae bacterium]
MIDTKVVTPAQDAKAFLGMTFPTYTHLLSEADLDRVIAVPVAAFVDGVPAGLILGAMPKPGNPAPPTLFSVFVDPAFRNQGVGTRLMEDFHKEVAERGGDVIRVKYMTGKEATAYFERILQKTGWEEPTPRMAAIKADLLQIRAMDPPWLRERRISPRFKIIPWSAVTEEQKQNLRLSHEKDHWIAEDLVPWMHEAHYDPVSSCALLRDGELAAWVINHHMRDGTTRFTCSFAHPKLQRLGVVLWLYKEAVDRAEEKGRRFGTWTVPLHHPAMHAFAMRWMKPCSVYCRETYGSEKKLTVGEG